MAFQRNAGFTSAIATDPAATAAGLLTPARYNLPFVVSGADVGGIPFCPTAATETTSANLTYGDTLLNGGPGIKIGTGNATLTGWYLGYLGISTFSGIWGTSVTPSSSNYVLAQQAGGPTFLNSATSIDFVMIANGSSEKARFGGTAGFGMSVTGGTAATDVAAFSLTRTNNNAAVATGVKWTFTDTTSAAGFLAFQILGGAAGTTSLISVSKAGKVDAPSYAVGGTNGASGGPFTVITSITVVNGIVTAITGS